MGWRDGRVDGILERRQHEAVPLAMLDITTHDSNVHHAPWGRLSFDMLHVSVLAK